MCETRQTTRLKPGLVFFALMGLLLFGASSGCGAGPGKRLEQKSLVIVGGGGEVPVKAEIARTGAERAQGLMYRKELEDGSGMLFVFDRDEILSFWMKNTLIPLSIAYIASDGRIVEIYDMEPGNLNPVKSSRSVRYALEVPQGWFARAGIGPGSRLVIDGF
jgi:uncharacterized membrane protein (UPF0127 family)